MIMKQLQTKRIAIYARVSTNKKVGDPKRQETENQLRQLRQFAKQHGWKVEKEYTDNESGRSANRKQFEQLFQDAHQRQFDLVLFWSLDRFSREGVHPTLTHLRRLNGYGVDFRSFTEQYIDSAGEFSEVIISLLATLAKQEAVRHVERINSGLERAKAEGKTLGRPKTPARQARAVKELRDAGQTMRQVAQTLGISAATVLRIEHQAKKA